MVSTLTQAGAEVNLRALEIGAFDCIAKPSSYAPDSFATLAEKVKAAARSRRQPRLASSQPVQMTGGYMPDGRILGIGSSTGGVEALITVLSKLPVNCPPTIISQHMPPSFTKSFAARLNKLCQPEVSEAQEGDRLRPGQIFLCPGEMHLELSGMHSPVIHLSNAERVNGHRPSVDVMFYSLLRVCGKNSIGLILTGLGRDGAEGLLALHKAGAETIGQDEASCVVYGMPRAAFEIGAVSRQLPLERIAERIITSSNALRREHAV